MGTIWRKTIPSVHNLLSEKCVSCTIATLPGLPWIAPPRTAQRKFTKVRSLWTSNYSLSAENIVQTKRDPLSDSNESKHKVITRLKENIGFIGGGNMAYAIGSGLINREIVKPAQVLASDLNPCSLDRWRSLGTNVTQENSEVVAQSDIIFLCLKPHILEPCALELKSNYKPTVKDKDKLFVSVLAGVQLSVLEQQFSFINGLKMIRTMPNTPMQVGEGCIVYTPGSKVTQQDSQKVNVMMKALGIAEEVPETLIDAIAGVTSCGPAFCFTIIEALADGSVKQGVPRQMALQFAAQTILGAAKTVIVTGKHPAVLRDEVCSPGGSTICGVYELERGNLRATLINAVEKAAKKNAELGQK